MRRRTYLATTALTLSLAGCASDDSDGDGGGGGGGGGDGGGDEQTPTATAAGDGDGESPTTTEEETTTDGGAAGVEPMEFSGTGTDTTDNFELLDGATTVDFKHSGESNFQVELLAVGDEGRDDLFVNEIGSIEGGVAAPTTAGTYRLNINADGDWSVTIAQPRDEATTGLPVEESGSGATYIGPIAFDGLAEFSGSHTGDSNFQVQTVPVSPEGYSNRGALIFNEVGEFEGSTSEQVEEVSYVDINADGEWSLEIQSA